MTTTDLDTQLPAQAAPVKKVLSPEEVEALINDNMRLAYYYVNKYQDMPGADRDDIERQAVAGLVKAANRYNPNKGPFTPYAAVAIQKHLAHMKFHQFHQKHHEVVSLNAPRHGDSDDDAAEYVDSIVGADLDSAELRTAREEARRLLDQLIQELTPRERDILRRSLSGESYRDMQKDLGISFVQVGNLARAALAKLRRRLEDHGVSSIPDILPEHLAEKGDPRLGLLLEFEVARRLAMAGLPECDRQVLLA